LPILTASMTLSLSHRKCFDSKKVFSPYQSMNKKLSSSAYKFAGKNSRGNTKKDLLTRLSFSFSLSKLLQILFEEIK